MDKKSADDAILENRKASIEHEKETKKPIEVVDPNMPVKESLLYSLMMCSLLRKQADPEKTRFNHASEKV